MNLAICGVEEPQILAGATERRRAYIGIGPSELFSCADPAQRIGFVYQEGRKVFGARELLFPLPNIKLVAVKRPKAHREKLL